MNPCFKIGKFFWKAAGEKSFHSCSSLCLAGSYGKVEAGQGKVLQCKETQCANEQASAGNFIVDSLKSSWRNLDVAIQLFIVSLTTEKLLLRWGKCTWFWYLFFFSFLHFKDEHKAGGASPETQLPSEILAVPDCTWRNRAGAGIGTSL